MFIQLFNSNIFIYTMLGICGVGFLIKVTLKILYHKLMKASYRMGVSKHKLVKDIRIKYETLHNLDLGVNNVDIFVDKSIYNHKFCGILLSTWETFCGQLLLVCVLLGSITTIMGVIYECGRNQIILTMMTGLITTGLLIVFDGMSSTNRKKAVIRLNILNYLENVLRLKMESGSKQFTMLETTSYDINEFEASGDFKLRFSKVKESKLQGKQFVTPQIKERRKEKVKNNTKKNRNLVKQERKERKELKIKLKQEKIKENFELKQQALREKKERQQLKIEADIKKRENKLKIKSGQVLDKTESDLKATKNLVLDMTDNELKVEEHNFQTKEKIHKEENMEYVPSALIIEGKRLDEEKLAQKKLLHSKHSSTPIILGEKQERHHEGKIKKEKEEEQESIQQGIQLVPIHLESNELIESQKEIAATRIEVVKKDKVEVREGMDLKKLSQVFAEELNGIEVTSEVIERIFKKHNL